MSSKKSIVKLSLVVAVVATVLAMFIFSLSLADEAAKPAEEAPAIPETASTEGVEATAEEAAAEETPAIVEEALPGAKESTEGVTAEASEEVVPNPSEDTAFTITKSNGQRAVNGEDYDYHLANTNTDYPVTELLTNDLTITGDPNIPVDEEIQFYEADITNITFNNVNISMLGYDNANCIYAEPKSTSVTLNFVGNCTLSNSSIDYGSIELYADTLSTSTTRTDFYINGLPGSKLNINNKNQAPCVYVGGLSDVEVAQHIYTHFSGDLKGNWVTENCSEAAAFMSYVRGGWDDDICSFVFEGNTNLDVVSNGDEPYKFMLYTESSLYFKDNANVSFSSESDYNLIRILNESQSELENFPSVFIEDNASVSAKTTNDGVAVWLTNANFNVNTTGFVSLATDDYAALNFAMNFYENSGKLNIDNGTVYISGSDSDEIGPIEFNGPYEFDDLPEGYSFVGSDIVNAPIESLDREVELRVEPSYSDYTSVFFKDIEEDEVAKTVAFIPPYVPPEPEPTPDVPGGNVQEVDTAAQTGDSALPIAVIAIVAVAAAGAAFGARKLRKN